MDKNTFQKAIDNWNKKETFSGVISIRQNGKPLIEKAYGYRNKPDKLQNNQQTRFAIASGTKIVTAIAILILIDKGKLNLDSKIKDILDLAFPNFDKDITVYHLLTHTSGIKDYFDEEDGDDFEDLWKDDPMYKMLTPSDLLVRFLNNPMKFKMGEKYSYNNLGFVILGRIIEIVSGQDYHGFITEKVLKQCNMNDSGFFRLDMLPENTAIGYLDNDENETYRTNYYATTIIGGADGGMYTTVDDHHKLWASLRDNKFFSKELKTKMVTSQIDFIDGSLKLDYGLGVYLYKKEDKTSTYFTVGGDPGCDFFSIYSPELDLVCTVMGNSEIINTWYLMEAFQKIISDII